MRATRVCGFRLPPVPPPPKPRGPGTFAVQPGFPDTPCLFTGLSAGPVGHRQPGSEFPRSPAAGEGDVYVDDVDVDTTPYPTFGTDSQSASSLTCPGRPTINHPQSPLRVCVDRDRAAASQRTALPVECGASADFPAHPASPATQRVWGTHAAPSGPRHHPGRRSIYVLARTPQNPHFGARAHRNLFRPGRLPGTACNGGQKRQKNQEASSLGPDRGGERGPGSRLPPPLPRSGSVCVRAAPLTDKGEYGTLLHRRVLCRC